MQPSIDIHAASEDERLQGYRNVHDVWSRGLSMEDHLRHRQQSIQHNRADWFVGCIDDRVVTSLGCYPLHFQVDGKTVPGIAIGAVHTLAEYRGQGFAPRLIEYVERQSGNQGCQISMLYSDIKPDYYARLGYQLCRAWEGWVQPSPDTGQRTSDFELEQFNPTDHVAAITEMYAGDHGNFKVSIARDQSYAEFLIARDPDDDFYWLRDQSGAAAGYVRLASRPDRPQIREFALAERNDQTMSSFARALVKLACETGIQRLNGWLPNHPALRQTFNIQPRKVEITMLKSISPELTLNDTHCADAQNFCEIDHV